MKVLKFGGSSVGNPDRINAVIDILKNSFTDNETGAVVFSAYHGITDKLIKAGEIASQGSTEYETLLEEIEKQHLSFVRQLISVQRQSNVLAEIKYILRQLEEILHGVYLIRELSPKSLDFIMSFGERLSAYTISECLTDRNFECSFMDTRNVIKTDKNFGRARVNFPITNKNILSEFDKNEKVRIVTGFIGSSLNDETTTLGRGGSDFTASIFGAALNVAEIEIWTDVDGVLTADPRKVPDAFPIPEMTYEEAMELSHFGAKVIYPPTMQPALDKKIPLRIKNTMNPDFPGTVISHKKSPTEYLIRGISSIDDLALLTVQGSGMIGVAGIAQRIFSALARQKINIILITQASSEHSICIAILPQFREAALEVLNDELKYEIRDEIINAIDVEENFSVLAVVGENMRHRKGLAARVFQALGNHDINISAIAQGSSELNISIVVSKDDEARALRAIHSAFFKPEFNEINIFLIGTGLIGSTFLKQLKMRHEALKSEYGVNFKLAGIANIEKMLIQPEGIDISSWNEKIDSNGVAVNLSKFSSQMIERKVHNGILVDCTADEKITDLYKDILAAGISIVTPNKKANSRDFNFYKELRNAAKNKSRFLYETNVGAGLPVIGTIQNLVNAGDEIYQIEGILSGTLSYIFNTFTSGDSFSELIRKAKEKGYTEPDPRDDLNGLDVARKILILARETGASLNLKDVTVENLIPEKAKNATSIEDFFIRLKEYDNSMSEKVARAEKSGKKLRCIAEFKGGKAKVSLAEVDDEHPFYNMQGSDNIIAIYSKYYETPLVIKGPGAGADVTAAGVFADVLRLSLG